MVYDEMVLLQRIKHPHIVRFHDWFESKVRASSTGELVYLQFWQDKYYIVTQLATGGELFDRICEYGKFTEKDAARTIKEVLEAVDYLHYNNVVHRGTLESYLLDPPLLIVCRPEARKSVVPHQSSRFLTCSR